MSNHSGRMRRARLAICGWAMPGKLWKVARDSGCEIFRIQVGKVWCNSTGGDTHSGGLALECTFKAPQGYLSSTPGNLCELRNFTTVSCEHQRNAVICHLLPTPNVYHHRSSLIAEAPPPHCTPRNLTIQTPIHCSPQPQSGPVPCYSYSSTAPVHLETPLTRERFRPASLFKLRKSIRPSSTFRLIHQLHLAIIFCAGRMS